MQDEYVLVVAPNEDGRKFIKLLMYKKIPFVVLTNSAQEEKKFKKMGVTHTLLIHTAFTQDWILPEVAVGRAYIFENSLNLSCRYLQICRPWTSKDMYIVTRQWNPRGVYRGMGADYVIYTTNGEVGFLLNG